MKRRVEETPLLPRADRLLSRVVTKPPEIDSDRLHERVEVPLQGLPYAVVEPPAVQQDQGEVTVIGPLRI
jgi:hypothetical protein